MDINIKYHKWKKKDYQLFNKSCKKFLNFKNIQFYQPYFSLFFHIYNSKNANKCIDLDNPNRIQKIINNKQVSHITSNSFVDVLLFNKKYKIISNRNHFVNVYH